ncbi:MAG: ABC-F family ATP-binding cassette domain-containing protein [Pirellulales bacterium]
MILLRVEEVVKHYGPEAVLAGASFELRPGERLALVGPNGAGKTTLLRILAGQEEADSGKVELHPSARLEYLEQQPVFAVGVTVWQEARRGLQAVLDLQQAVEAAAAALAHAQDEAEHRKLADRYDRLEHELRRRQAYAVDHQIERVLQGLGFGEEDHDRPVAELSGGQKNRLLLGRMLLAAPDVMLLDEPSNHLDIDATQWLEQHLAESEQALIVVSHDRYLLDKVATRTLELFQGTVDSYPGNFSAYWRQKAERLEVQRRTFEKQQLEIAKTEEFIRRNHYGQKAAQAEDRRKKLERIERVAPPREIIAPPMGFTPADRTGDIVLRVEGVAKGFDRPLFSGLSFDILRGERWGILGPNGAGKTTLLRCLVGELALDAGRVSLGTNVRLGYFDQQLSGISGSAQTVEAIRPPRKEFNEQQRRGLLARFGLSGEIAFQPVDSLSGGERNRAALARLAATDPNVLVLDEPTNHLDLWARDALEQALRDWNGTVLFVSHDRYFMNRVADHLLVVEPGRFRVIEGNYDAYRHLVKVGLSAGEAKVERTSGKATAPAKPAASASAAAPGKRKRKYPYRKVADLEADIELHERLLVEQRDLLCQPEVLRDGERMRAAKAELARLEEALPKLYEHWEEASELN